MTQLKTDAILMMEIEVDPSEEAEINEWYHNKHLPELCSLPGIRAARRYKVDGEKPRYVAIYYLDHPGAIESEAFREWRQSSADTDRMARRFLSVRRTMAVEVAACGDF